MTTRPFRPERRRALRDALHRPQSLGPLSVPLAIGLGSGFATSFGVDALLFGHVDTPWRQLADAAAFTLVAAPVWIAVQRRDVRDAHDVMTWLNGWETERWQREIGRRLPALPRATPAILDTLPDTMGLRPLRVELLAVRGELDEARERLESLPADTAWQRFERAALEEWIAWWADEPERIGGMKVGAAAIDDRGRALVARTMVAAARARRTAVEGGDAIGPLAAIRPELGNLPGRYAFAYRTGIVVSVAIIGIVASLAVMVTAAVIR